MILFGVCKGLRCKIWNDFNSHTYFSFCLFNNLQGDIKQNICVCLKGLKDATLLSRQSSHPSGCQTLNPALAI